MPDGAPTVGLIRYRELAGYKYQLVEDAGFATGIRLDVPVEIPGYGRMEMDGALLIKAGYCWSGPSGPAIDTRNFLRASMAHDFLYQCLRTRRLGERFRAPADALMRHICIEDGMSRFRAWYAWAAVRAFAGYAARPDGAEGQEVVRTAP